MSKHKAIPKKTRLFLYDKYNHRCAYCGCQLEYKDVQIDHIKSVYANTDIRQNMTDEEMYSIENLLPSCRQCNFYKSSGDLEIFRENLSTTLYYNLRKNFNYKLLKKYGLIAENIHPVKFYFEELGGKEND